MAGLHSSSVFNCLMNGYTQNGVLVYCGILYSVKKEGDSDTGYKDEP